jgi:hypothetical protein
MELNNVLFPSTYEVGSSTDARQKKQTPQDSIDAEAQTPGTEGKGRPYGVAKPYRIIIRARITHD